MIELTAIHKTFNENQPSEFKALKGIDLTLDLNRMIVFSGPSGSGKTTLLSLIGCMARPTSGRIFLKGQDITSLPERFLAAIRRETFGFTFQQYHLIRGMSLIENVMLPAYPSGKPHKRVRQQATSLLAQFELETRLDEPVENLSGGQQQRAAIARALINEPDIIIADEPTAHLDHRLSAEFMQTMERLRQEGRTILIASHDPLVTDAAIVDRVVHLRDGRIVEDQVP